MKSIRDFRAVLSFILTIIELLITQLKIILLYLPVRSNKYFTKCLFYITRLSQSCNHVAALLFKVEHAYKLELSNPACTSTANVWKEPSGAKIELNMRIREMKFFKPDHSKGKGE